ncbi:DUF4019 domain-containing protein [Pacificispira sp.]|uniref:DUF4019 domain-containing protein n=1 Tax=Pacificispira sp. TaxID=2888761 RepID=UPI003BAC83BD
MLPRAAALLLLLVLTLWAPSPRALAQDSWQPTQQLNEQLAAATAQFWALLDARRFTEAYGQLAPGLQNQLTLEQFTDLMTTITEQGGAVSARRHGRVTWYRKPDPNGVPTSFAAVDFLGTMERAELYCGYLLWHVPDDGGIGVLRVEQNFIPDQVRAKMTDDEVRKMTSAWRCMR